ncbi:MAG: hypothetical protein EA409_07490 [Saprospirales bacterium]|nr:MAG: hypothetical protein EA409_07490 [Saprospirales bacterium]
MNNLKQATMELCFTLIILPAVLTFFFKNAKLSKNWPFTNQAGYPGSNYYDLAFENYAVN